MQDIANTELPAPKRTPWNKAKLTGAKPPLRQKYVWAIRTKLQIDQRTRDLAIFNLAIDSKLRGCDVVALKVEDVAPNGYSADRATVRQKKTLRRRSVTPAHPLKSAEKRARELGTWFDMYPGRAANPQMTPGAEVHNDSSDAARRYARSFCCWSCRIKFNSELFTSMWPL